MIVKFFGISIGYKTFEVMSGILTFNTNHNSLQLTVCGTYLHIYKRNIIEFQYYLASSFLGTF